MDRELPNLHVLDEPEGHPTDADDESEQQQIVPGHPDEVDGAQIRDRQIRLARPRRGGTQRHRQRREPREESRRGRQRTANRLARCWKRNTSFAHVLTLLHRFPWESQNE